MKTEIAIIGLSLKVNDITNLEDFWKFVQSNEEGFNYLSGIRRKDIFERFGECEIVKGSYLDRIDQFDYNFFKISLAEAERMDPEQRLMMEHAVKAVNNAGYLIRELKGQRIGVFHTYTNSRYKIFFDDINEHSVNAHHPGMQGTRIAHFMDWRGPVMGINTSCSSALSTLYYACESVANGQCTMALAGGVNFGVIAKDRETDHDEEHDFFGEGVFSFLLKKAEDAIRDNDPIHAIIKGGAMNHGGALIQRVSAPSPVAQAEVIRMAWENSNIEPARVGFIETKTTGTELGDQIELRGIATAFENAKTGNIKCSVSSVTGQLGHLGLVSGFAGLVRLILALKNNQLLPHAGIAKITNSFQATSGLSVQQQMQYWESSDARVGGITSYGRTGTNVHMVLQEHVLNENINEHQGSGYMIKLGGRDLSLANKNRKYLLEYLRGHPHVNLNQLCYSINKMIDEHAHGELVIFNSADQLASILESFTFSRRQKQVEQQVLLFNSSIVKPEQSRRFIELSPSFSLLYNQQLQNAGDRLSLLQQTFILHYCAIRSLMQAGFTPSKIIGAQSGKLVSLLLSEKITVEKAIKEIESLSADNQFDHDGFNRFLDTLEPAVSYMIVVTGSEGAILDCLKYRQKTNYDDNIQFVFTGDAPDSCLELIKEYYNSGNNLNFESLFGKQSFLHDIHLPMFEYKRCWPVINALYSEHLTAR